ncbi:phosphatase PAP2 family protein [Streptomyces sp. NPDC086989]|uniref:phosphatase PAP2 family protein n=1 Tax=Streptomyces sp. NPDC086989 TaxID=3365764 RepID=UPI00380287F8
MRVLADVQAGDHRLTRRIAAWDSPAARRLLSAVADATRHTKLWWAAALAMAAKGGSRGRRAAAAGILAMAVAEVVSNGIAKQLVSRRRPPVEWIPHGGTEDRPDSSSFPSGHTAAAVAFTATVAAVWPWAGAAVAVPTVLVAFQRINSGAHYPSDVVAGGAIGAAVAALVRAAPRLVLRSWRRPAGRRRDAAPGPTVSALHRPYTRTVRGHAGRGRER